MQHETLTIMPAGDLRPTPPATYGPDPETPGATAILDASPPKKPKKPKGISGANQYGTRHLETYRHKKTLEAFLKHVQRNRTKDTANVYLGKLRPLLRHWDALDPQDWTNLAFEDYYDLAKAGKAPGQLQPMGVRALQLLIQSAKLFGEWCLTHGIKLTPVDTIDPKTNQHRPVYFWQAVERPESHRTELTGLLTAAELPRPSSAPVVLTECLPERRG